MANAYFNTPAVTAWPPVGTEVYVKRAWADAWTWLPFIYAEDVRETVAPQVSQARLRYEFGRVNRAEIGTAIDWAPYALNGAYVRIIAFSAWGYAHLWTGIIDVEIDKPDGRSDFPSGTQWFVAYGLEHLLDRTTIHGSYTEDGFIDRPLTFNTDRGAGMRPTANRSAAVDATGTFSFGTSGEWTNYSTAYYLLGHYAPTTPTWYLVGQTDLLNSIERHNFEGETVWEALTKLADRRRGVGMRVLVPDANTGDVYLLIFSMLSEPLPTKDAILPANAWQRNISFNGYRNVQQRLHYDELARYQQIRVHGGRVTTTVTLTYANGGLAAGWSSAEETAYKGVSGSTDEEKDQARQTLERRRVYQRHVVPASFWTNAQRAPSIVSATGELDTTNASTVWPYGKEFERQIPFEETTDADVTSYRPAFATILDRNGNRVMLEKLRGIDHSGASLRFEDGELAIWIESGGAPHVLADGHFNPSTYSTLQDPELDYEDLEVTVMLELDVRLKVVRMIPGLRSNEVPRVKDVYMPEAETWWVAPNVKSDESTTATSEAVRNDASNLRFLAALAAAWYGRQRATIQYEYGSITINDPCGTMIRSMVGPEGFSPIGTVVTSRTWYLGDWRKQRTVVTTGYDELAFAVMAALDRYRPEVSRPPKVGMHSGTGYRRTPRHVSTLPAIPTAGKDAVTWRDQVWEAHAGDAEWRPTTLLTAVSGIVGSSE